MFYLGNLDDAVREAFHKPAKEVSSISGYDISLFFSLLVLHYKFVL